MFKCHKSILARNSDVFEAMFSLPSPSSANEMYEEVPVAVLPDPVDDVKTLLQILYEPWYVIRLSTVFLGLK